MNLNSNTVTITAWVNSNGIQNGWQRDRFLPRRQHLRRARTSADANELRYTWNDDGNTFGASSGLIVPDSQWVLAALVLEPDPGDDLHGARAGR